jgi:hypothetical protein
MAHYALLNQDNIVTQVIVGRNEDEVADGISDWEAYYGELLGSRCVRTSYNNNIRKQYAGIGYTYDEAADEFVAPQPYASWALDSNNDWQPPVPRPAESGFWEWNESEQKWER